MSEHISKNFRPIKSTRQIARLCPSNAKMEILRVDWIEVGAVLKPISPKISVLFVNNTIIPQRFDIEVMIVAIIQALWVAELPTSRQLRYKWENKRRKLPKTLKTPKIQKKNSYKTVAATRLEPFQLHLVAWKDFLLLVLPQNRYKIQ